MRKNIQSLQKQSVEDLKKNERTLREEIAKLTIEAQASPQKDTNQISRKRKQLAQLLTVRRQKELNIIT